MDHKNFLSWTKQEDAVLSVNTSYYVEVVHMLFSRMKHTDIPFWEMIEHMGEHSKEMQNTDNFTSVDYAESSRCFYIHFAFLIKFLYPMMEQLQASVDKNIQLSENYEKD